jgi:restriction system protein
MSSLGKPVASSADNRATVEQQLLEQLLAMKYLDFERLVLDLLGKSGYTNVQLADRIDCRGRTMQGGLDLKAFSETDLTRCLTIAQLKQYKDLVPRRFVDEIRGAMLRVGAKQGLLITTSACSPAAHAAAVAIPLLPVTLIEGPQLLNLLIGRQIGVREETVQRLVVNEAFFAGLS